MVIWLIGLSGAGKSTIGREVYKLAKAKRSNTVYIDGDEVRAIFAQDKGPADYSVEGRRKNGERISELCAWLDRQGIDVVCAILSIFEDQRQAMRSRLSKYFEVYVSVPFEQLVKNDSKGIYRKAATGEVGEVVGVQIPFVPPSTPDLVVDNSGFQESPRAIAERVLQAAERSRMYDFDEGDRLEKRNTYQYTTYFGAPFLEAWQGKRAAAVASLPAPARGRLDSSPWKPGTGEQVPTDGLLKWLSQALGTAAPASETYEWVDQLLQRVEVTKRVHERYTFDGRRLWAAEGSSYKNLRLYLGATDVLLSAHAARGSLQYLNGALKLVDTLVAKREALEASERAWLAALIELERKSVEQLVGKLEVSW